MSPFSATTVPTETAGGVAGDLDRPARSEGRRCNASVIAAKARIHPSASQTQPSRFFVAACCDGAGDRCSDFDSFVIGCGILQALQGSRPPHKVFRLRENERLRSWLPAAELRAHSCWTRI